MNFIRIFIRGIKYHFIFTLANVSVSQQFKILFTRQEHLPPRACVRVCVQNPFVYVGASAAHTYIHGLASRGEKGRAPRRDRYRRGFDRGRVSRRSPERREYRAARNLARREIQIPNFRVSLPAWPEPRCMAKIGRHTSLLDCGCTFRAVGSEGSALP